MTFKANDRIYETSVTTGVGDYTLAGAQTGFQSFSAWGANNEGEYFITDDVNWESGIGKYITGPARLQRSTILESSNGGAAVNWGAGAKKLRSGKPAAMALPRALSLSVAGGAGTTVLTSDQANREVLEFTGALTGNRVMEVDATVRDWAAVYNNTTGAFTLTMRVTGQTGLAITQGESRALYCDGTDVEDPYTDLPLPLKHISGFTYANNAGDAANDIDIAAGSCRDSTNAMNIVGAALTKQSDAAWAVGTNAGGLDDIGSAGNNDFYIWAIKRPDTGVVDYLFSLSSTAPAMPASYDFKRLIGWFKRVGGTIVLFHTYETAGGGLEMNWDVPTLDINLAATLTTARRTDAVKVPLNVSVMAHIRAEIEDAGSAYGIVCSPDEADAAPVNNVAPLHTFFPDPTLQVGQATLMVRTSSTGTIAARASTATVDQYRVLTIGFNWARRN